MTIKFIPALLCLFLVSNAKAEDTVWSKTLEMVAAHPGYQFPPGEWNYQVVTVRGSTIKVELNGVEILDADLSKVTEFMGGNPHAGKDRKSGFFGFAGHNDSVAFRNISIRPLV